MIDADIRARLPKPSTLATLSFNAIPADVYAESKSDIDSLREATESDFPGPKIEHSSKRKINGPYGIRKTAQRTKSKSVLSKSVLTKSGGKSKTKNKTKNKTKQKSKG